MKEKIKYIAELHDIETRGKSIGGLIGAIVRQVNDLSKEEKKTIKQAAEQEEISHLLNLEEE